MSLHSRFEQHIRLHIIPAYLTDKVIWRKYSGNYLCIWACRQGAVRADSFSCPAAPQPARARTVRKHRISGTIIAVSRFFIFSLFCNCPYSLQLPVFFSIFRSRFFQFPPVVSWNLWEVMVGLPFSMFLLMKLWIKDCSFSSLHPFVSDKSCHAAPVFLLSFLPFSSSEAGSASRSWAKASSIVPYKLFPTPVFPSWLPVRRLPRR